MMWLSLEFTEKRWNVESTRAHTTIDIMEITGDWTKDDLSI